MKHHDSPRSIAAWLEGEAPDRAPTRLIEASRERIRTTPQGRAWLPAWKGSNSNLFARLGVTAVAVAAIGVVGLTVLRQPSAGPGAELGVFAPVAGRIVSGVWGVDPEAVDPSGKYLPTSLRIGPEEVLALGWSRDGTELLLMRRDPTPAVPFATNLFILHADRTETQLTEDGMEMWGATIAPDGSRVVYAARDVDTAPSGPVRLFAVDATGGQPVRIAEEGERPTFSPDGSQIAYAINKPGEGQVWVANADGSDAHEILADWGLVRGVDELAWSPTGDRITMEEQGEGHTEIYSFAPDGSEMRLVITGGARAFWSPDGLQIAYLRPYGGPRPGLAIADADGSNVREFGFGASGPWHPGTLMTDADAPASPSPASLSPSTSPASPSSIAPTPGASLEAERIIAEGTLHSFAATQSGTLVTIWARETCRAFGAADCVYAWRLGEGSQARATGILDPGRASYDSGDEFVPVAAGDGFILTPPSGHDTGIRIAPDGTVSSLSMACRDVGWSTPTEPGRLVTAQNGFVVIDTVAGTRCERERIGALGGLVRGVFTAEGTLWALVDNEVDPAGALTIGWYDGVELQHHDFATRSGSWTSILAAAGETVVVLLANPEPSPRPDQLVGLAVTTDAGATWSEVVDPEVLRRDVPFSAVLASNDEDWFSGYTSMAFAGPSTLYVADGNGDVWRSTDFTTFSQVEAPGGVKDLTAAGDAVIARTFDGSGLVRISADGRVAPIAIR